MSAGTRGVLVSGATTPLGVAVVSAILAAGKGPVIAVGLEAPDAVRGLLPVQAEYHQVDLRKKLNAGGSWPQVYMFKFIVPSDNQKIALTESLFEDDAEIKLQPSSKGTYTSVTARVVMMDAEQIINIYKKASEIEGIISL